MEILQKFGFDTGLFLAQVVNFLILAFVFKKFLYKPILKTLETRRKKIAQGIADAEKAEIAKQAAEQERDRIIKEATTEAQKIIDDMRKHAEEMRTEILEEARTDADKIIATAKEQSDLEMERMRKEAGSMSLTLSKSILNHVLSQLFTKDEQAKIMKKGLKEIETNG